MTCRNDEKNHLQLAFGHEGGGGGGTGGRIDEKTTSGLRLDAREEVVVGDVSKERKITTYSLRLDAREVVVVCDMSKERKKPPPARVWMQGRWWWWVTHDVSKERKKPPPARIWMRGRPWWWVTC